jgi:hypothetical protein
MARKKIREYDSKRLLREHLKRLAGIDLQILSAQVSALFSLPDSLSPSACVAGRRISAGGADRDPAQGRRVFRCASEILRLGVGGLGERVSEEGSDFRGPAC